MAHDTRQDRHTAHISEVEAHTAHKRLDAALSALEAVDQWQGFVGVAIDEIKAAKAVLKVVGV